MQLQLAEEASRQPWGEGWGLKVWSSQNDRGPGWLIMYKQVQVDLEFEIFVYPHLLKDFLVTHFR